MCIDELEDWRKSQMSGDRPEKAAAERHKPWCASVPRPMDSVMGRGPYPCDCGAEAYARQAAPPTEEKHESIERTSQDSVSSEARSEQVAEVGTEPRPTREELQEIVKGLALPKCGETIYASPENVMGCGESITRIKDLFRCAECEVPFHLQCLKKHFVGHGFAAQPTAEGPKEDLNFCSACQESHPFGRTSCRRCHCDRADCYECGPWIAHRVVFPPTPAPAHEARPRCPKCGFQQLVCPKCGAEAEIIEPANGNSGSALCTACGYTPNTIDEFAAFFLAPADDAVRECVKPDTIMGVYCDGNPEKVPWILEGLQNRQQFWEGWKRVADYVNKKFQSEHEALSALVDFFNDGDSVDGAGEKLNGLLDAAERALGKEQGAEGHIHEEGRKLSDFGETLSPVGRKVHRCIWCLWAIPKGEKHKQYKGTYDGEWQNWRMHNECFDEQQKQALDGFPEFTPGEGEPPERIKVGARSADTEGKG